MHENCDFDSIQFSVKIAISNVILMIVTSVLINTVDVVCFCYCTCILHEKLLSVINNATYLCARDEPVTQYRSTTCRLYP